MRFKFSILHLIQAIWLVGFVMAAARWEEYSISGFLRAVCVGLLSWGLAVQAGDLWKARSQWRGASFLEKQGLGLAIGVRVLVAAALVIFSLWDFTPWIVGPTHEQGYPTEQQQKLATASEAIFPILLLCGLLIAPWHWKRSRLRPSMRILSTGASALALGAMLTLIWFEASTVAMLVHIAIEGVKNNVPIYLEEQVATRISQAQTLPRLALTRSLLAMLAAAGSIGVLLVRRRISGMIGRGFLAMIAVALTLAAFLLVDWVVKVALPTVSPQIAASNGESEERFKWLSLAACCGAGIIGPVWLAMRRPAEVARTWRRRDWYFHESRLFHELLVFGLVVEQVEFFRWVYDQLSQFASLLKLDTFSVAFFGMIAGTLESPLELAMWIVALGGLFASRRSAPAEIEQTPSPVSLGGLLLEIPIAAVLVYVFVESMLWSNFFFWISAR